MNKLEWAKRYTERFEAESTKHTNSEVILYDLALAIIADESLEN